MRRFGCETLLLLSLWKNTFKQCYQNVCQALEKNLAIEPPAEPVEDLSVDIFVVILHMHVMHLLLVNPHGSLSCPARNMQDNCRLEVEFDDEPIIVAVLGEPGQMVKAETEEDSGDMEVPYPHMAPKKYVTSNFKHFDF